MKLDFVVQNFVWITGGSIIWMGLEWNKHIPKKLQKQM
jgi:hypothetical protein